MRHLPNILTMAGALALLAACSSQTEDVPQDTLPEEPAGDVTAVEDPGVASPADEDPDAAGEAEVIPAAIQGRWGLVPADCTSTLGDAKGLLEIDATRLTFYESVGTLDDVEQSSANAIRADFDFTGEGMEWERDMSLTLEGDKLVRREFGEDALAEPLTYTKCA